MRQGNRTLFTGIGDLCAELVDPMRKRLLIDIGDLYAGYKRGNLTRTAYHARRTQKIEQFKRNMGPLKRLFYLKKGVTDALRPGINLLPTDIAQMEAARLQRIAGHAAKGGVVLTGIGVTAACAQIAHTLDPKEKNEIFVETVASTFIGTVGGVAIGAFIVSNPVGWGTAVLLAMGSAFVSWRAGEAAKYVYDAHGNQIDLVNGLGVDKICH